MSFSQVQIVFIVKHYLAFCSIENSIMYFLTSVYFAFIHPVFSENPRKFMKVRSGDRGGQICWPPPPHLSVRDLLIHVLRHVSTEMWGAPSRWKYIWYRVLFLFKSSLISIRSSVTIENRTMFIWHFWLGMTWGIRSWSTDRKSWDTLYNRRLVSLSTYQCYR
jgi:hypothetical protein